jgi:glycosyl transferase family 25
MAPFRSVGEKGVFLSHLRILELAAEEQLSVLILEDDVDFTAATKHWDLTLGCDIAYGGYTALQPEDLHSSDIIGAHCMGFSARAAKALVPFLEELLEHDSPPPIDGAYVWFRRKYPEFVTEFADPIVGIQRPSRSDIATPGFLDSISVLQNPVAIARNLKRLLKRREIWFGLREAVFIALVGTFIAAGAAVYYTA